MRLVSFDAFRTLGFPSVHYLKPELMFEASALLEQADWVLFPEYWQLNSLVYGMGARVFPSPATYHLGHTKIEMTRLFRAVCPRHTPDTLICANTPYHRDWVLQHMGLPMVAKESKNSMGRGVFLLETEDDLRRYWATAEVLYLQEYLPIDRDLRLILIGGQVLGGYWRVARPGQFHHNVARGAQVVLGPIPDAARVLVESIAAQTGIDHAGFDIAMVGDHPYVLEFNRLFGNQGVREAGMDVNAAILQYLAAASHPPFRSGGGAHRAA